MQGQQTESSTSKRRGRGVGRKDKDGQEAVINRAAVYERQEHLIRSYRQAREASTQFSEDIKAAAKKAGLNAATVRRFIVAKASDDFEEAKRKVSQLSLLFDTDTPAMTQ